MRSDQYEKMNTLEQVNWWYLGRRYLVRALYEKFHIYTHTALDLGCGTGEGISIFNNNAKVKGIDISEEALLLAKEKGYISLTKASAERLPFEKEEFDTVLSLDVIEHIENDTDAIEETYRVLKPSGYFLLTIPAYQWLWSGHDVVFAHKRRYTKKEILKKLKNAGFTIVFASYYVAILFPIIAVFRLLDNFFSKKAVSHFFYTPKIINVILFLIMKIEITLINAGVVLPFGSSIVIVVKKH